MDQQIVELELELPYFYIPFDKRYKLFGKYLKQGYGLDQEQEDYGLDQDDYQMGGNQLINIRRGHEFEDGFNSLLKRDLKKKIIIKFENEHGVEEMGIDAGGVYREFI